MNLSRFRILLLLSLVFLFPLNTSLLVAQEAFLPSDDTEETSVPTLQPLPFAPSYKDYFTPNYLNLEAIYNDLLASNIVDLVPPPEKGSKEAHNDEYLRENVAHHASPKEREEAFRSRDSIFSYSYTLGKHFNPHELPKTAVLFRKLDIDVRLAIYLGKRFFGRHRPLHSSGYSYPSGHSTRAFMWEALLTELFPENKEAFLYQAEKKAWNRVILGRHYPADLVAGKAYGTYLAQELLKNPAFKKDWEEAKAEIKENI